MKVRDDLSVCFLTSTVQIKDSLLEYVSIIQIKDRIVCLAFFFEI